MAKWEFAMSLDRQRRVPLFQQIARALMDDIRRGRLRPGDPLPGTRTLARALGVQRLTAIAAYDELMAEGWTVTRPARGAFVSPALPDPRPRPFAAGLRTAAGGARTHGAGSSSTRAGATTSPRAGAGAAAAGRAALPPRIGFDLPPGPPGEQPYSAPPGTLFFAPNRPDVRLIPHDLIGRAYRRAIRHPGGALLSYDRPQGHERLCAAVAGMLSATRGMAVTSDDVCITRGSQMGNALLARALLRPGDRVAVEALTFPPAAEVFRLQGATVVGIPVDREGLTLDPIERLARDGRLRAVHVTPHHQFPTTVMLSAARRLRLLELARRHRFAIIEEDYDHEYHYDGHPVWPLAAADPSGSVAYVGTFSKVLAPGLRVGYVVAPRPLLARLVAHRTYIDIQGDQVLEYALAELIEDGAVQRHIRRVRREYAARRDVLVDALRRRLGGAVSVEVPAGGLALWVRAAEDVDIEAWAARARAKHGVSMVTASSFALDGEPRPFARLGFASLDRHELVEAVRRLAAARR